MQDGGPARALHPAQKPPPLPRATARRGRRSAGPRATRRFSPRRRGGTAARRRRRPPSRTRPCAAPTRLPRQERRDRAGRRSGGKARPIGAPGRFFDAQEEAATIDGTPVPTAASASRAPAPRARSLSLSLAAPTRSFGPSRRRRRRRGRARTCAGDAVLVVVVVVVVSWRTSYLLHVLVGDGRRFQTSLSRIVKGRGTISTENPTLTVQLSASSRT
jgi:hypothetical protein